MRAGLGFPPFQHRSTCLCCVAPRPLIQPASCLLLPCVAASILFTAVTVVPLQTWGRTLSPFPLSAPLLVLHLGTSVGCFRPRPSSLLSSSRSLLQPVAALIIRPFAGIALSHSHAFQLAPASHFLLPPPCRRAAAPCLCSAPPPLCWRAGRRQGSCPLARPLLRRWCWRRACASCEEGSCSLLVLRNNATTPWQQQPTHHRCNSHSTSALHKHSKMSHCSPRLTQHFTTSSTHPRRLRSCAPRPRSRAARFMQPHRSMHDRPCSLSNRWRQRWQQCVTRWPLT